MCRDLFGYRQLEIPPGAFAPDAMSTGEPGPPRRVVWGGVERAVAEVQRLGKRTARDRGGSGERYVDRHRFRLLLDDGTTLEAYFDRRARRSRRRWWAHEIE